MKNRIKNISQQYNRIVYDYISIFCERYEIENEYELADIEIRHFEGLVMLNDYYIDFDDLVYFVNNNVPYDAFDGFYWYQYEQFKEGKTRYRKEIYLMLYNEHKYKQGFKFDVNDFNEKLKTGEINL